MYMSEQINELAAALAKAQAKIRAAFNNKSNQYHKSSFADLDSIWSACRDPLTENGLSVVQVVQKNESELFLVTLLTHASGQWIKSEIPLKWKVTEKTNESQALGAAITYARRYGLASISGVPTSDIKPKDEAIDDDDDGEASAPKGESLKPGRIVITKDQATELESLLSTSVDGFEKYVRGTIALPPHNAKTLEEMPMNVYEKFKDMALKNQKKS